MTRLYTLLAVIYFLPPAAAQQKPSLKEYAATLQGRHSYGVYAQKQKVGWMIADARLGKHDGKDVLITIDEFQVEVKRGEDKLSMDYKTTSTFSLEGDGDVLVLEDRQKEGGREVVRRGERKGDKFVITSTVTKRIRTVSPPKRNLLATRQLDEWLRSTPKKDAVFESWATSIEDADVDRKETYTFKGKQSLTIGGVPTDIFHVLVKTKGVDSDLEIMADGTPIKGTLASFFEIRSEPEAAAKKRDAVTVDLLELASIRADKELGLPERVEALTLEVIGLGNYPMPTSHRQQVKPGKQKEDRILELKRDFRPEKAAPLTDAERKKMLEATPQVQADEDKVKELAKKIVGDETDVTKKARKIARWVYTKVRKSYTDNASTTLEVLELMAGDCTEHSLLFVSLARAAGFPSREVGGVGYSGPGTKSFTGHAWAEFHDGHQWVSIDPTWNQERVDATHVKFSDSADDMAWANIMGKVKFKVIAVEKK